MPPKRLLLIGLTVLLLAGLALLVSPPGKNRYRADSMVIVTPYTQALFDRSFQSQIIRTIPGMLSLHPSPTFSGPRTSSVPVRTNGVSIRIVAVGATPEEAQQAANEAGTRLCQTTTTNFGVKAILADQANSARKSSYFHDTLQPAITRLFGH